MQVAAWQKDVREKAKKDLGLHRVQTMLGRHRMLPGYGRGKTSREEARASRAAINTPIQGSAADVVAAAMVRIHHDPAFRELGWRMLLQVHDEVRLDRSLMQLFLARAGAAAGVLAGAELAPAPQGCSRLRGN